MIDEGLSQHKHLGGPGAGGAGEGGDEGAFGQGVSEANREEGGVGSEGSAVPDGSDQTEPARPEQAPEGDDAAIMGKLPHSRPQRRSAKRTGASRARRAAPRPASVRAASTPRRKPAATTKAPAATASPRKQNGSLPGRALEAAVSTAAIPIKVSAAVARRAANLIGRNIRSR